MNKEILNENKTNEITYMIIPSKVNIEDLFYYLAKEVSFEKILTLYIKLRTAIITGKLGVDEE